MNIEDEEFRKLLTGMLDNVVIEMQQSMRYVNIIGEHQSYL